MKKILFVLLVLLTSIQVFAKENSCCKGISAAECSKAPKDLYQGIISGYVNKMVEHQIKKGKTPDKKKVTEEIMKIITYKEVYDIFQKCGQRNDTNQECQKCVMKEILNKSLNTVVDNL